MPVLTLPDGSNRSFDGPVTGAILAADIGAGLAKAALAITVDGEARDLEYLIETDAAVSILTEPRKNAEPRKASASELGVSVTGAPVGDRGAAMSGPLTASSAASRLRDP